MESATLDGTIRSNFKMVHFNLKMQNPELVNLKCVTYIQPIPLSLMLTISVRQYHSYFLKIKYMAYSASK